MSNGAHVPAASAAPLPSDPAEIQRSVETPRGTPGEVGPPLVEAGASLFTVGVGGPEYDLSTLRRWLAWRETL